MKGIEITQEIVEQLGGEKQSNGSFMWVTRGVRIDMFPPTEDSKCWNCRINNFRQHPVTHVDELIAFAWSDAIDFGKALKQNEIKQALGISPFAGIFGL